MVSVARMVTSLPFHHLYNAVLIYTFKIFLSFSFIEVHMIQRHSGYTAA